MSNNVFPETINAQLNDFENKKAMNTMFGELTVGQRSDNINVQFQYSISGFDIKNPLGDLTGTGSVSHITNMASVESGTGVGSAKLSTRDSVRYRPGHECLTMFTSDFTSPEVNTFQHYGIFNGSDGFYLGYKDTVFSVFMLSGGSETPIPQSSFNQDKVDGTGVSGFVLNPERYNIYKISFGWLGIAPAYFSVYAGHELGWVLMHVIDLANTQDSPHIENPSLPVSFEVGRTSGTGSNIHIQTSSIRAGVIGESRDDDVSNRRFAAFNVNLAAAANTITHLLSLKPRATYQGKSNHVRSKVEIIVSANSGNKDVIFKAYSPSQITPSTPLIYADVNTAESTMQTSITAATITEDLPPNDVALVLRQSLRANTKVEGFSLYAGDEVTFAVDAPAGGGGDMSIQINWREEF
jgi:hypothetical protein